MDKSDSDSDLIIAGSRRGEDAVLTSDFGGEVVVFKKQPLIAAVSRHQKLLYAFFKLTDLENQIDRALAAAIMRQGTAPDFLLKEYKEGETIICEGEQSTDIFEMLSGSAKAVRDNIDLGKINEGEIFGEVSFFTGEPRNATVTATETCMVRVINDSNFAAMIKNNPNFATSVSRTLAKRFTQVNKRLSGNGP